MYKRQERRSYGQELSLCQRYYWELGGYAGYQYIAALAAGSTTIARGGFLHPVPMRASPTFTHTGANTFALEGNAYVVCSDFTQLFGSAQHVQLAAITAGGLTTGSAYVFLTNNNTNARLRFNAEL